MEGVEEEMLRLSTPVEERLGSRCLYGFCCIMVNHSLSAGLVAKRLR